MSRFVRAIIALSLGASAAQAQSATASAQAFFQAQSSKQWMVMATLVDSSSMHAVRAAGETMIQQMSFATSPEAKAMMDSMGAPGASKMIEGLRSMMGPGSIVRMMFARVQDPAELTQMTDTELMARWFEAKSPGYLTQMGGGLGMSQMLANAPPEAVAAMQEGFDKVAGTITKWDVIGELPEGPTVAHVMYRVAGQSPRGATAVLTFERGADKRWRIHFTSPDEQMAQMNALAMAAMKAGIGR